MGRGRNGVIEQGFKKTKKSLKNVYGFLKTICRRIKSESFQRNCGAASVGVTRYFGYIN